MEGYIFNKKNFKPIANIPVDVEKLKVVELSGNKTNIYHFYYPWNRICIIRDLKKRKSGGIDKS